MCAAVGHFCNGSHKVFRFEAPMKFGVHVVCPQAQVNEAVVLVHYIVQHSVLLFGPVVQAGVLLTEAIAKAHCQFKLCFCQECVCTIPQALELHNRLHACNHGCMDLPVSLEASSSSLQGELGQGACTHLPWHPRRHSPGEAFVHL